MSKVSLSNGNWTVEEFGEYLLTNASEFVSNGLSELDKIGVQYDKSWTVDHVCYRCASIDEYNKLRDDILPHLGYLLVETIIGGRPIACYKLNTPIHLGHNANAIVDVLEVPSPKPGSHYDSGLEHFEMVVPYNLDKFLHDQSTSIKWDLKAMSKNLNRDARISTGDSTSVKFHEQTLESVIAYEIKHGL